MERLPICICTIPFSNPMILPYHHSPPLERDGVLVIIRLVGPRIHLTDPPTVAKRTAFVTRFNPAASSPHSAAELMEPISRLSLVPRAAAHDPWRLRYRGHWSLFDSRSWPTSALLYNARDPPGPTSTVFWLS